MASQQQTQRQRQGDYRQGDGTAPDPAATFGDRPPRPTSGEPDAEPDGDVFDIREQHQDPFQHY